PERVVLLVREGCHLCVDAIAVVGQVCAGLGVPWRSVDVDTDPDLRARFTDHVPVTLVDGVEHARWFVDPDKLAAALTPSAPASEIRRDG
ncbi:MAG: glutaredoxin family protein, partial [Propionicimonas sp.]